MDRAEVFQQLATLTPEIESLKGKLGSALATEKELYAFLKLPHPNDLERPEPKKRITKEKVVAIRLSTISVMRELGSQGLTWLPLSLIVGRVNQEIPEALEDEIKTQVRWLAKCDSAPVEHNGERGHGSTYRYIGTQPVPQQ